MRFSLKKKTVLLIVSIVVLTGVVALLCSWRVIHSIVRDQYEEKTVNLSKTIALAVDAEKVRAIRDEVVDIYAASPPAAHR